MVVNSKPDLNTRMRPAQLLIISAMPTPTKVRLVSRNWRTPHLARRCISTPRPPQPPAFVFDIVSVWNPSGVEVADPIHGKDGVLLRGETVLEPTRNAFRILHGDNPFNRWPDM